jgi:hypothetical protein
MADRECWFGTAVHSAIIREWTETEAYSSLDHRKAEFPLHQNYNWHRPHAGIRDKHLSADQGQTATQ